MVVAAFLLGCCAAITFVDFAVSQKTGQATWQTEDIDIPNEGLMKYSGNGRGPIPDLSDKFRLGSGLSRDQILAACGNHCCSGAKVYKYTIWMKPKNFEDPRCQCTDTDLPKLWNKENFAKTVSGESKYYFGTYGVCN